MAEIKSLLNHSGLPAFILRVSKPHISQSIMSKSGVQVENPYTPSCSLLLCRVLGTCPAQQFLLLSCRPSKDMVKHNKVCEGLCEHTEATWGHFWEQRLKSGANWWTRPWGLDQNSSEYTLPTCQPSRTEQNMTLTCKTATHSMRKRLCKGFCVFIRAFCQNLYCSCRATVGGSPDSHLLTYKLALSRVFFLIPPRE